MKKAKAPSAKTLARKAQEAALIAWAKQQQAKFQADLREMFAKEKRERLGMKGSVGTGGKTARLVVQAPGLENRPRLSDLLLGDADKRADGILTQLRRSRELAVARAKAMARADAARRPGDPGGTGITTGRNQVAAASLAVQGYIDERGAVRGKLGTPVRENTYIPPSVRDKVAQAVRTDSPAPTTPQPVSADYAGGGWYEHRSTKRILWMRGLRSQAGLDRLGIPGKYLGNSFITNNVLGDYDYVYLSNGKTLKKEREILRSESGRVLKTIEDISNTGYFLPLTIIYEYINGIYVFVRAMVGAQPKSISGRGLNNQEKVEAGLNGLVNIGSAVLPAGLFSKGFNSKTKFQGYSKMTKGEYSTMKDRWHGFKMDRINYDALNNDQKKILQNAIPQIKKYTTQIDSISTKQ